MQGNQGGGLGAPLDLEVLPPAPQVQRPVGWRHNAPCWGQPPDPKSISAQVSAAAGCPHKAIGSLFSVSFSNTQCCSACSLKILFHP